MLNLGSSDSGWSDEIKHKLGASFEARQNLSPRVVAQQTVGSCWLRQSVVLGPKDVTEEGSMVGKLEKKKPKKGQMISVVSTRWPDLLLFC